jgi:hypothetical protein
VRLYEGRGRRGEKRKGEIDRYTEGRGLVSGDWDGDGDGDGDGQ